MAWQVLLEQAWPVAQAFPQAPQFAGLVAVSTQVPPQSVVPVGQPQAPPMQTLPPLQVVPQAPQLALSDLVSTHEPPQLVRVPAQLAPQVPTEQTWPAVQAVVHEPQWAGSAFTSTQVPEQSRLPGSQTQAPFEQILPPEQVVPQAPQ
jgi:hypothetical protein